MIGNDIIDLKLASSFPSWRRKRFRDKVFSVEEQKIISDSLDPFQTIWLLWSMKESAYKTYSRKHSEKFFAPIKLKCKLTSFRKGIVEIFDEKYRTYSTIEENYIYSIAHQSSSENVITNFFKLDNANYSNQHCTSYKKLLHAIAEEKKVTLASLTIRKDENGIPYLFQNNQAQEIPFSVTHHGNFGAYAILK